MVLDLDAPRDIARLEEFLIDESVEISGNTPQ